MSPSRLIGAWITDDGDPIIFLATGACSIGGAEFRYTDDGAMVVLNNEEGNAVLLYQLVGERLILLGDEGPLPMTRVLTTGG